MYFLNLSALLSIVFLMCHQMCWADQKALLSCTEALNPSKTFSSILKESLKTLDVEHHIDNVDLGPIANVRYLSPSSSLAVYTVLDKDLLNEKGFYINELSYTLNGNHRIVETDFGFVVLDHEALEAWSLL